MGQLIYQKSNSFNEFADNSIPVKEMLTPTTATLTLNSSAQMTPFSLTDSMVMFANGLFSRDFVAPTVAKYVPI
jgi:hypothetical protein